MKSPEEEAGGGPSIPRKARSSVKRPEPVAAVAKPPGQPKARRERSRRVCGLVHARGTRSRTAAYRETGRSGIASPQPPAHLFHHRPFGGRSSLSAGAVVPSIPTRTHARAVAGGARRCGRPLQPEDVGRRRREERRGSGQQTATRAASGRRPGRRRRGGEAARRALQERLRAALGRRSWASEAGPVDARHVERPSSCGRRGWVRAAVHARPLLRPLPPPPPPPPPQASPAGRSASGRRLPSRRRMCHSLPARRSTRPRPPAGRPQARVPLTSPFARSSSCCRRAASSTAPPTSLSRTS